MAESISQQIDATKAALWQNPSERPQLSPADVDHFYAHIRMEAIAILNQDLARRGQSQIDPVSLGVQESQHQPRPLGGFARTLAVAYRENFTHTGFSTGVDRARRAGESTTMTDTSGSVNIQEFERRLDLLMSDAGKDEYLGAYAYINRAIDFHGESAFTGPVLDVYSNPAFTLDEDVKKDFPLRLRVLLQSCNPLPEELSQLIRSVYLRVESHYPGTRDSNEDQVQAERKEVIATLLNAPLFGLIYSKLRYMPCPFLDESNWEGTKGLDQMALISLMKNDPYDLYTTAYPHLRAACVEAINDFVLTAINSSMSSTAEAPPWFNDYE